MLRTVLLALFGVVSILHGPCLTLAKAGVPSGHQTHVNMQAAGSVAHHDNGHAFHDRDNSDRDSNIPPAPNASVACLAFDCCTAVTPPAIAAAPLIPVPLATLKPPLKTDASPFASEPVVPPPRPVS